MKIQNPGSAVGGCNTPLNVSIMLNSNVAMLPAVSASGMAAMMAWANVLTNSINCTTNSSINPRVWPPWFLPKMAKYHETHIRTPRATW
jgi:hypothetical protein